MVFLFRPSDIALITFVAFSFALSTLATYTWPNYVMDELEHLLVDTGGFNDGGIKRAITPCTNYVSGSQLLGRETAAQWIRVAFHDFATAHVSTGTGGLDASIGFETLRAENTGSAMNDTVGFFAQYVNAHVSMADLLALGVVMSVGSCSSPTISIPLQGGRIDATAAGPTGVPEPQTDLPTTLLRFSEAGFSPSDAITLTACGHSIGNVHHSNFPDVVTESAVTPNNTGGGVHFDSTVDTLDIVVLEEYLTGIGQKGGPLVTTSNITVQSDSRLYTSDNNATIRVLVISPSYFASKCNNILSRMINTVPAAVTLTDVIVPNLMKPVGISVSVNGDGTLIFSGYIRLLSSGWSNSSVVIVSWVLRDGLNTGISSTQAELAQSGTSNFGTTYYYSFSTGIDSSQRISSFTVYVKDGSKYVKYANGGSGYPVQDTVVWMPAEISVTPTSVSLSAAVLTSLNPKSVSAVFSFPTPQSGTLSPKITTYTLALTGGSKRGPYTLYTGLAMLSLTNINGTSVDIIAMTSTSELVKSEFNKFQAVGP